MRCQACNKNLNDYESSLKNIHGEYLDMCKRCLNTIRNEVNYYGNLNLMHMEDDEGVDNEEEPCYNEYYRDTEEH